MKQLFALLLIFLSAAVVRAQAPMVINYQGVARNASGTAYASQQITVRLTIHTETPDGTVEYREIRNVSTNQFGLFNIQIGSPGASAIQGNLAAINWSGGNKFLQTEISVNGQAFSNLGATQMVSVPFAVSSQQAKHLVFPLDTSINANSSPVLKIKNTSTSANNAISGESINGVAIAGSSETKSGVAGAAFTTQVGGVTGSNPALGGYGVHGYTAAANYSGAGVFGQAITGAGVKGETTSGNGVLGTASGAGVGVNGQASANGYGVYALTASGHGLFATATTSTGTAGRFYHPNTDGKALIVEGNLQIKSGNTSPGAGKVLTSDADGNATWKTPAPVTPAPVGFLVSGAAQGGLQNLPNNTEYKIHPAIEEFDGSNNFSLHNQSPSSTFTAPAAGLYRFTTRVTIKTNNTNTNITYSYLRLTVKSNGVETVKESTGQWEPEYYSVTSTIDKVLVLKAGDQVWLKTLTSTKDGSNPILETCEFAGYLIR
ncbi:MAG: hypothetical protein JNL59_04070, partial [Chitinophagaceae bacterium]|nr:hypothetical protein [Chitinophagaceae bacterium]